MTQYDNWFFQPATAVCESATAHARQRQQQLTKPAGSLGVLENLAVHIAGLQACEQPDVSAVSIDIFAGDHGITEAGISAFPSSVTADMIRNFSAGGAAITVLARAQGIPFKVHNLGTLQPLEAMPSVENYQLAHGTDNFLNGAAMSPETLERAFAVGLGVAEQRFGEGIKLVIAGEMGIGNTTSASALACALMDLPAEIMVGPGTGLDAAGMVRKIDAVNRGLALHVDADVSPVELLRRLGGLEIAAMTGFYIACAQRGLVVLVDGFICSVAALLAMRINPSVRPWLLLSHQSAEPGHCLVCESFLFKPLLNLGLRLGEGSGAALALPLLQHACFLHNGMATFTEASIALDNEPSL